MIKKRSFEFRPEKARNYIRKYEKGLILKNGKRVKYKKLGKERGKRKKNQTVTPGPGNYL